MNAADPAPLRLTQFSHGGGCGCKIAPGVLQQIIAKAGPLPVPQALLDVLARAMAAKRTGDRYNEPSDSHVQQTPP